MSQVVPPPESDHSTWELERATLETPSEDPVRAGSNRLELCGTFVGGYLQRICHSKMLSWSTLENAAW